MRQLTENATTVPEALQQAYAPIRKELDEVEELLRRELRSQNAFVDRLAKHGFRLGGKRLRPALVLLAAKAAGRLKSDHLVLAAAVELIHTATLVHDDVLDEATLRRHLDTVNARWDNEASVLLGDYLFTRSICLVSSVDGSYACRAVGEATQIMCEGELQQVESRGNYDLTEEEYFNIIGNKTAALVACCCRLGAHYSGADPEVCDTFSRFGQELGVAFQIADDLLDVLGDEAVAGKSLGTDLVKQKATLPLIRLLSQADAEDRGKLIAILSSSGNHHREALQRWFEQSDAIEYSRDRARWHARRAGAELDNLPPSPVCEMLKGLTEFVVTRRE